MTTGPTLPSSISGGHRSVHITWEDCEVTGDSSDAEIAADGFQPPRLPFGVQWPPERCTGQSRPGWSALAAVAGWAWPAQVPSVGHPPFTSHPYRRPCVGCQAGQDDTFLHNVRPARRRADVVADELRRELVAMLRTSRIEGYTRERRALLPALVC